MCGFCSRETPIETTIGGGIYELKISLDEEHRELMKVRLQKGSIGLTRPILIYYCPFCGEKLKQD